MWQIVILVQIETKYSISSFHISAHTAVVTVAIFAPNPAVIIKPQFQYLDSDSKEGPPETRGEVLVSADFNGFIRVFINKFKPGSG